MDQKLESFRKIRADYFCRKAEAEKAEAKAEAERKATRAAYLDDLVAAGRKKNEEIKTQNIRVLVSKYGYTVNEAEKKASLTVWDDGYDLTIEEWLRQERSSL